MLLNSSTALDLNKMRSKGKVKQANMCEDNKDKELVIRSKLALISARSWSRMALPTLQRGDGANEG